MCHEIHVRILRLELCKKKKNGGAHLTEYTHLGKRYMRSATISFKRALKDAVDKLCKNRDMHRFGSFRAILKGVLLNNQQVFIEHLPFECPSAPLGRQ